MWSRRAPGGTSSESSGVRITRPSPSTGSPLPGGRPPVDDAEPASADFFTRRPAARISPGTAARCGPTSARRRSTRVPDDQGRCAGPGRRGGREHVGKVDGILGFEGQPRLTRDHDLAEGRQVADDERAFEGHGLVRLERGHELSHAIRGPGHDEDVDDRVVGEDLVVIDPSGDRSGSRPHRGRAAAPSPGCPAPRHRHRRAARGRACPASGGGPRPRADTGSLRKALKVEM